MVNDSIHEITDEAIREVPRAVIASGGETNKYIQSLCKDILRISKDRSDGYSNDEVGILSSLDGKFQTEPIYGYWNEEKQISIIDIWNNEKYQEAIIFAEKNSLVFVHNHPDYSKVSYNDLINLITTEAIKIVVAVSNNGNVSFAFRKSNDFSKYAKLYKKIQTEIYNKAGLERRYYIDKIYNDMINNPSAYGLIIAESRR